MHTGELQLEVWMDFVSYDLSFNISYRKYRSKVPTFELRALLIHFQLEKINISCITRVELGSRGEG